MFVLSVSLCYLFLYIHNHILVNGYLYKIITNLVRLRRSQVLSVKTLLQMSQLETHAYSNTRHFKFENNRVLLLTKNIKLGLAFSTEAEHVMKVDLWRGSLNDFVAFAKIGKCIRRPFLSPMPWYGSQSIQPALTCS